MEVVEVQQFNMIQGFYTAGKNIRVKVQVKPGLIGGMKLWRERFGIVWSHNGITQAVPPELWRHGNIHPAIDRFPDEFDAVLVLATQQFHPVAFVHV